MRQLLDLYICLRPCKAFPGNPLNYRDDIDLVVFRENTEGMYIGVEFPKVPESFYSRAGDEAHPARCRDLYPQRHARRLAPHRARGLRVCRPQRAPQGDGGPQGQRPARHLRRVPRSRAGSGQGLPAIEFDTANVDAMCMWLLKNPQSYDVIVTTNLFGDILSDLCAQLVGGMGFAYSGNIGERYAVFEPTHGSAPKYAGQNKVNPIATILAAKMMVEWLGDVAKADRIEQAVAEVIAEGRVRTYDLGGTATTSELAAAHCRRVWPNPRGSLKQRAPVRRPRWFA